MLLVVLGSVHMVAQHFTAPGGLRTYDQVVSYLRQPAAFVIETAFLVVVIVHALLGARAVALDLGPARHWQRRLDLGLLALGILMTCYGIGITLKVVLR